jgi:hypothetical protein
MIVVDIWGGTNSNRHVARSILELSDALKVAEQELLAGYLVNLRSDLSFGLENNFDERQRKPS